MSNNKILFLFTISFFFNSYNLFGQQNFFNVPSSDITDKNTMFFQEQFGFTTEQLQTNLTLSFGLGRNYEVGINIFGLNFQYKSGLVFSDNEFPYNPLYIINGQKKFIFSEKFSMGLGGQIGINKIFNNAFYIYSNFIYFNEKYHTKIVCGPYYSSDGFFGLQTRNWVNDTEFIRQLGIQMGIEQNIWKKRLYFQADYISGLHSFGQMVLGGAFYFTKHWVISLGYQIPNYNSQAINEVILEFTFVP